MLLAQGVSSGSRRKKFYGATELAKERRRRGCGKSSRSIFLLNFRSGRDILLQELAKQSLRPTVAGPAINTHGFTSYAVSSQRKIAGKAEVIAAISGDYEGTLGRRRARQHQLQLSAFCRIESHRPVPVRERDHLAIGTQCSRGSSRLGVVAAGTRPVVRVPQPHLAAGLHRPGAPPLRGKEDGQDWAEGTLVRLLRIEFFILVQKTRPVVTGGVQHPHNSGFRAGQKQFAVWTVGQRGGPVVPHGKRRLFLGIGECPAPVQRGRVINFYD